MEAVLFDLYDTFAWTRWSELSTYVAERLGSPRDDLYRAYDRTRRKRSIGAFGSVEGDMAAILEAAGTEPTPALVAELVDHERTFLADGGVTLFDDSLEVAAALNERGVKTALVSNCSHSTIPIVERLGLAERLDAIVLSVEVGSAKPEAGAYQAALERLDVPAERALFVDDQVRYCDGAAAIGIDTRLIVRPGNEPLEGRALDTNGHRVIARLDELLLDPRLERATS